MRFSRFFTKTRKTPPAGEESANAIFLEQAGFIEKEAAGVYTFLPLGLRVLNKIENIVREEMDAVGGEEILMPALHPFANWETTGRWGKFDALFKTESQFGGAYALGPTHEEIIYPLTAHFLNSYKDLPIKVYQIQTKFRDEKRPKAGLLRAREFRMKDFYSFHQNDDDRNKFYETMKNAYLRTFKRLGLEVIVVEASGGTFSDLSLEFQAAASAGEDIVFRCRKCGFAQNREIAENLTKCKECGGETDEIKTIEVGNIFPLKEKFAKDFGLKFKDSKGKETLVSAGCYGFGTSRVMGTIVEISHDQKGMIWPDAVAPFSAHLIELGVDASKIYDDLVAEGVEVLYDDRAGQSAGEKFADADLIGIPLRIVISEKTLKSDSAELKRRSEEKTTLIKIKDIIKHVK